MRSSCSRAGSAGRVISGSTATSTFVRNELKMVRSLLPRLGWAPPPHPRALETATGGGRRITPLRSCSKEPCSARASCGYSSERDTAQRVTFPFDNRAFRHPACEEGSRGRSRRSSAWRSERRRAWSDWTRFSPLVSVIVAADDAELSPADSNRARTTSRGVEVSFANVLFAAAVTTATDGRHRRRGGGLGLRIPFGRSVASATTGRSSLKQVVSRIWSVTG